MLLRLWWIVVFILRLVLRFGERFVGVWRRCLDGWIMRLVLWLVCRLLLCILFVIFWLGRVLMSCWIVCWCFDVV